MTNANVTTVYVPVTFVADSDVAQTPDLGDTPHSVAIEFIPGTDDRAAHLEILGLPAGELNIISPTTGQALVRDAVIADDVVNTVPLPSVNRVLEAGTLIHIIVQPTPPAPISRDEARRLVEQAKRDRALVAA